MSFTHSHLSISPECLERLLEDVHGGGPKPLRRPRWSFVVAEERISMLNL